MMDERRVTHQYQDSTIGVVDYRTYGRAEGYPVFFMHGATPLPFSDVLIDFIQRKHG